LGTEIATRVRRLNPDTPICFYGLYAWLNAEYLLREHADYAIAGEGEQALLGLVQALERGDTGPLPGVSSATAKAAPVIERLDLPVPDRAGLPETRRYARLMLDGLAIPAGYTEATRGCHHTCLHCPVVPIYQGRFFAIPRATVLADIRAQVHAGAGHITFGDPDFLNGPTHALRICRALHEEFPGVTFDFTARIEHLLQHRDLLPEFRELGCVFVLTAVETISAHILEKLDKGHTRQDVIDALAAMDAAAIAMRPSLLPFTPWTSLDDFRDLLAFFAEYDLAGSVDPVHFSIRLLVPPGSALLDQPETASWIGPLDEANFTYTWQHPDPRVDALQRQVAALVERAAREDEDPAATFAALTTLAWSITGETSPLVTPVRARLPGQSPRLTESWFC
ncbi:MAG: CUAEP/CCAEP-tail radical SAM protein, partial [Chloroflexota bacterium]|nr:CUAEP/CCAEP-tail radical SAM protein [Chloroflexota bacterium]